MAHIKFFTKVTPYINRPVYQTGDKTIPNCVLVSGPACKPKSAYNALDLSPEVTNKAG